MDQKQLSQLDPKLKAVYDRVMGVANTAPPPPSDQVSAPPAPPPLPSAAPEPLVPPAPQPQVFTESTLNATPAMNNAQPLPSISTPAEIKPIPTSQEPIPTLRTDPTLHNQPMEQVYSSVSVAPPPVQGASTQVTNTQGTSKSFLILFIVLGIIFFVLYGVFWSQLFHIGIPGLSTQ